MELRDKTVFVTGAAQGVGRAVAEAVLEKGAKVCITDINSDIGETALSSLQDKWGKDNAIFLKCDVSDSNSFETCFETAVKKLGKIDVFVNNAGIVHEKNWEKCIGVNLSGVVRGTMLALEHMRKDRGGQGGVIVNTASTAGLGPGFWVPVYAATKSGVVNYTASWAANPDMKDAGVRLAVVCPSGTSTAMVNDLHDDQLYHKQHFIDTMHSLGLCDMNNVAEAFIQAIEDASSNGCIYVVTAKDGIKRVKRKVEPEEEV